MSDLIDYPFWWSDPAHCPWSSIYLEDLELDEVLDYPLIDDDNDDYFYLTTFGYIHESSVQD
jgi:hypothetical protein